VWTPEQVRAIIGSVLERYRALIACAALTGARLGELLALRWKHIDSEGGNCELSKACGAAGW